MVLALSGRFEPHTVIDVVDGVLVKANHERVVSVPEFNEPPQVKRAYIERKMPVGKPLFCIGIKDVDIPSDAFERYRKTEGMNLLLNLMLSESSEFYLNMLESGLVSPGFDSGYSSGAQNAYTMISGESDDPEVLLEKIKEQIALFRQKGIDKEAFEREKRCIYASYVSDFDSTEDIAFALTSYAHDGMELFRYPDIIDGISIDYIQHLLDTSFDGDRFTLSVIRPLK
jgi:predicted Zn-dependent peptidase